MCSSARQRRGDFALITVRSDKRCTGVQPAPRVGLVRVAVDVTRCKRYVLRAIPVASDSRRIPGECLQRVVALRCTLSKSPIVEKSDKGQIGTMITGGLRWEWRVVVR